MIDAPPRKRNLPAIGLSVLLLAAFFLLFDRLLAVALRGAAEFYYGSLTTREFKLRNGTGRGDGDALLLGSSRARLAFGRKILSVRLNKHVYGEAQAGKFPKYHYYFYRKYKKLAGPPKLVIYGLDYFMFEKTSAPLGFARLNEAFRLETLNPRGAVNPASAALSRLSWLYRLKPGIDDFVADLLAFDRGSEAQEEGDDPAPAPATSALPREETAADASRLEEPETRRPASWPKRRYRPFPGVEGAYFRALLDDLQRDGIPTFLVILPEFIGTYETNFEADKFRQDMARLAAGYRSVHIVDFNRPERFPLKNPKMFRDSAWGWSNSHLSDRGTVMFTQRLAVEITEILAGRPGKYGPEGGRTP